MAQSVQHAEPDNNIPNPSESDNDEEGSDNNVQEVSEEEDEAGDSEEGEGDEDEAAREAAREQHLMQLFRQFQLERLLRQRAASQAEVLDRLEQAGHLRSSAVRSAFSSVDRKTYCIGAESDEEVYSDRPYRFTESSGTIVHLSAPSIYAVSVEALDFRRGLSFLNVGSGTGFLSTIIARLIGTHAMHHGVETRAGLVELSSRLAQEHLPAGAVTFHHASIHDVDVAASMRFDRIYVGAGVALQDRGRILALLKRGGACMATRGGQPSTRPVPLAW